MKRQFMKGLMSLCAGVMTLCAASSLFVSCYDDSALQEQVGALDSRVQQLEKLLTQLEELTARVNALYTLDFQVTAENELQYSFDGKTWVSTGISLDEGCPEVSLVDNGETVTIKVGDKEFTIEKPEEIVFELRAGKVYFSSEATSTVAIKSSGIEDITVMAAPKGWYAEINADGKVEITAPNYEDTQVQLDYETWTEIPAKYAASGYVKIHACSTDGKCMVGKLSVEVVAQALSVKAYSGNAYFTVATDYEWGPTYFYGVATKETLEAETAGLLKAMSDGGYDHYDVYNNSDELELVVSIEELLGEEPQLGNEYIVWAVVEDNSKMSYTSEDIVVVYYSPLQVTLSEVEAEKTAYNVTVNVEVEGAEGYVAVALPALYCDDVEYTKEQMTMALSQGLYYGKFYTENYSGSVLDIAAGTTYSMTGLYAPASDVYLFVLPIDGRSVEDYTPADVVMGQYTTAELSAGGSVNLTAEQVTSYMGQVYDYDIWDYVTKEIVLDPYTQLGVKVERTNDEKWSAVYFGWLDEATYADYGAFAEDLVDYLLENSYGNTPADVESWPMYITEEVSPATTKHFVAFVVDAAGKYGEIAHVKLTSKELVKADYVWVEPFTTNLTDGILKNNQTLEFTPVFEDGKEAASYKYTFVQTKYYNQYEGMDDAQVAEALFFSTSSEVKTATAGDLNNGVLYVEGHTYGMPYYFAIVPIDAEGNPGASAAILEYECVFEMSDVITEGAEFEATAPAIKVNFPEEWEYYPDGGWGDAAYYGSEYQSYYEKYNFYYEINYEVAPAAGTEVCTVLVDTESYELSDNAALVAGNVWAGVYGSWKTMTWTEAGASAFNYSNHYQGSPAPAIVLAVSWKDAEGNYYYKQYDLQEQFQYYADLMTAYIDGTKEVPAKPLTVVGKQWAFDWTEYAMMMGMSNMSACLDFGVSMEGYFMAGIDYEAIYGPDAAGMWMAGVEGYFEVEVTDATSGLIKIMTADMETGDLTYSGTGIEYSNLTETTCTFNGIGKFEELFTNVQATLMETPVTVMSQGIAM
ncbi:MAG: hypothetical protein IKZ08_01890 [Bacteroidales bacterium]|nr:hypothetical protein [Bacteroidales bacterium]MBR5862058.1 hypothetical protein [Bacteroidales bacterium]